jgi:hypothetical protein
MVNALTTDEERPASFQRPNDLPPYLRLIRVPRRLRIAAWARGQAECAPPISARSRERTGDIPDMASSGSARVSSGVRDDPPNLDEGNEWTKER